MKITVGVFTLLCLPTLIGCNVASSTRPTISDIATHTSNVSPTSLPTYTSNSLTLAYTLSVVHEPPPESELPRLTANQQGELRLVYQTGENSGYSRSAIELNDPCVDRVTATYSPDYNYIAIAVGCNSYESQEAVYLIHSDRSGLIRKITGYDGYESGTTRPIEWAPDSKSFLYYRAAGFSDAHLEVKSGLIRYYVENADRKYLAGIWGDFRWSPDGKWIAIIGHEDSGATCNLPYVLDASGGGLWLMDDTCLKYGAELKWELRNHDVILVLTHQGSNSNVLDREYVFSSGLPSGTQIPTK